MIKAQPFDFGANWKAFSERALTAAAIARAREDFAELTRTIDLRGRSFLDIGFGQGLSLLLATSMGANTVGCDINPVCAEVLRSNQLKHFPELAQREIPVVVGSILDQHTVELLQKQSPDPATGKYEIVHSWGTLHHTGDLRRAILLAASLIASDGYFIIAIYARHWSSKIWKIIKRCYNSSSPSIRVLLVWVFFPVIFIAKFLVTRTNPLKQARGMNFRYDVIDWLGGYPYEYATAEEIVELVTPLGFRLERLEPATVPTGCNQFIFRRMAAGMQAGSS